MIPLVVGTLLGFLFSLFARWQIDQCLDAFAVRGSAFGGKGRPAFGHIAVVYVVVSSVAIVATLTPVGESLFDSQAFPLQLSGTLLLTGVLRFGAGWWGDGSRDSLALWLPVVAAVAGFIIGQEFDPLSARTSAVAKLDLALVAPGVLGALVVAALIEGVIWMAERTGQPPALRGTGGA